MRFFPLPARKITLSVAAVAAGFTMLSAGPASAAVSGTTGTATIVNASNGTTPIVAGGSATQFTLKLSLSSGKPIAACSADSANGSTFEMSYLVHQGVDPSTLTYPGNQPSQGLFLYDQNAASPFEAVNTAPSTGQVNVSTFSFGNPFSASQVLYNGTAPGSAPSVWEAGIACDKTSTTPDTVTDFWNVEVTFLPSATDPNGYTFTAGPPATVSLSALPNATAGTHYSNSVIATGGTAPYAFSLLSGSLPTGVSLASNGLVSGTPTKAGQYTFTLRATDSAHPAVSGTRSYTTAVFLGIASSLTPGRVGAPYRHAVTGLGGIAPYRFSRVSGTLPPGLLLGPKGLVVGTPTRTGRYTFTVRVIDTASPPHTGTRILTISIA